MADDDDGGGDCALCCCSFILTSGLTALFLWLSLRTYKPSFYIQDFYVHALDISDNSTAARNNHSVSFTLKLKNQMRDKGVGYANISITLFYNSTVPVANHTVPEFYQGHGKTAHRKEVVEASGLPWAAAFAAVSNGSSVSFRVKVATRVRSKIMLWFNKRHSLVVAGNVAVDGLTFSFSLILTSQKQEQSRERDPNCGAQIQSKEDTLPFHMAGTSKLLLALCLIASILLPHVSAGGDAAAMGWVVPAPRSGCRGTVAECMADEDSEFELDSESNRRILATRRYISYGALQRNNVPCSRRGASYYNCRPGAQANPYSRGCSTVTRCRR